MSKKRNNTTQNEVQVDTEEVVENTVVEETPAIEEPVVEEVPVEETVVEEETPTEEPVEEPFMEEPVEEVAIEEPVVEEAPAEDKEEEDIELPDNYGDKEEDTPIADVSNPGNPSPDDPEADPIPEEDGDFYCEVTVGLNKRNIVEERLDKADISFIVTATGAVLTGPFKTNEEAIKGKKLLLSKGLKGTVITFNK